MKVQIVPYEEKYKSGVLACFKRNYQGMQRRTDAELYQWAKPMFTYHWQDDLSSEEVPYKYGVVLLAGEEVVGYLGFIYSKRLGTNGKKLIYTSGTTWAIDEGYRIYLFKAIKRALAPVAVAADFTAIAPVQATLTKVFKFQSLDQNIYEFFPFPSLSHTVKVTSIFKETEIKDLQARTAFRDHQPYPVYCAEARKGDKSSYIFYKVKKRVKTKLFGHQRCVIVLGISDRDFFSRHAHEIIWQLQKKEKAHLRCDSRFFQKNLFYYHGFVKHHWSRLFLNKTDLPVFVDYLYSEVAMLD